MEYADKISSVSDNGMLIGQLKQIFAAQKWSLWLPTV
jgi:hypothetical protein